MRHALLIAIFVGSCIAAYGDSPQAVADLFRVHHKLILESARDECRNEQSPYANIDLTEVTPEECQAMAITVRKAIEDLCTELSRRYQGLTDSEWKDAKRTLEMQAIPGAEEINAFTKRRIAEAIIARPSLDPRILSMSYIDKQTIKLVAGKRCSPGCAFGLHCYIARLEGDRWVIRSGDLIEPVG
jgi:hypothetical protein